VDAVSPSLPPGALYDVVVSNPSTLSTTLPAAWLADFTDVPAGNIFHDDVEKIFRAAITAGCGGGNYCPGSPVTRAQMAVFLLKAEHGSSYVPPDCAGIFTDVPCPSQFADWIEQLSNEGITAGCGGGAYCPDQAVTRQQMAVFLLKAEHGPSYAPPTCTGVFEDVPCPGQFTDWVEQLYAEAITGGCQTSPLLYCPTSPVNRGQMAVFLVKTFNIP
jgi:S-layer homology domain